MTAKIEKRRAPRDRIHSGDYCHSCGEATHTIYMTDGSSVIVSAKPVTAFVWINGMMVEYHDAVVPHVHAKTSHD